VRDFLLMGGLRLICDHNLPNFNRQLQLSLRVFRTAGKSLLVFVFFVHGFGLGFI